MSSNVLESYPLLISKGWIWLTNLDTYDEAIEYVAKLRLHNDTYQFKVGAAKATHIHTSDELKDIGMVAVYQSGGKTIFWNPPPPPSHLSIEFHQEYQQNVPEKAA